VGATKDLATAVWVGDPDAYTEMVGIQGFEFPKIQGGTYPARIWKNYMDAAHFGLAARDWQAPAPPERPNARLVLPGTECTVTVVGRTGGQVVYRSAPAAAPAADAAADAPPATPSGFRSVVAAPPAPEPEEPSAPAPEEPEEPEESAPPEEEPESGPAPAPNTPSRPVPVGTTPVVVITAKADLGTTIPPDILDPNHPLPSVPLSQSVSPC
jgi:membrane peptidoglycan carboxypeptidase